LAPTLLDISSLSRSFGGLVAVDKVTMSIQAGEVVALVGPNGAGKTTLFNLITGFLHQDSGTIRLKGQLMTGRPPHYVALAGVSRTFQDLRLFRRMPVLENVLLGFKLQTGESIAAALLTTRWRREDEARRRDATALLELVGLDANASQPAEALSYGQQKLLTISMCLASDPELLLLDEPIAGVQPEMKTKIGSLVRRMPTSGKSILFIEHNLEAVQEIADRVIVMAEGGIIAEGPPQLVLRLPQVIEAYLS
jgi:branched-chain amino acid transport system ATP-binding protein